jgi:beta-ketodecanoyl-[acyl-carrier-protein] synthase
MWASSTALRPWTGMRPKNVGRGGRGARYVFKQAVRTIRAQAERLVIAPAGLRRLWLDQANAGMSRLIAHKVLGHEACEDESPTVRDTSGNVSTLAGMIASRLHEGALTAGESGLTCAFGLANAMVGALVDKAG